jgi:omega-amidase
MKVAIVQSDIFWENPVENRRHYDCVLESLSTDVDLIVLPEMFNTGFTMNPEKVAETMNGETIQWMKSQAVKYNLAITGSIAVFVDGKYHNRLLFVFPSGEIAMYDKRHLFTLAGEDKVYTKGKEKVIINYKGFRICPQICYDLRFPVFSRNVEAYDLLLYVANWPDIRINAWDILLKARAVENQCFVIGVNRIGFDKNINRYNGHSQVIDFLGNYLLNQEENESTSVIELHKDQLIKIREQLNFLSDRDCFTLKD